MHWKETWYELKVRQDHLEQVLRMATCIEGVQTQSHITKSRKLSESSCSTSNPYKGLDGNVLAAKGCNQRRAKLLQSLTSTQLKWKLI